MLVLYDVFSCYTLYWLLKYIASIVNTIGDNITSTIALSIRCIIAVNHHIVAPVIKWYTAKLAGNIKANTINVINIATYTYLILNLFVSC